MQLTESRVRDLAREEMNDMFKQITTDVAEIKRALLGSVEYGDAGAIKDLQRVNNYVERAVQHNIFDRGLKAITWYEYMGKKEGGSPSKISTLEEMIQVYKTGKLIIALFAGSTIINIVVAIKTLLDLLA